MNEKKEKIRKVVDEILERAETEDLLYWSREYLTEYYNTHPDDFKVVVGQLKYVLMELSKIEEAV